MREGLPPIPDATAPGPLATKMAVSSLFLLLLEQAQACWEDDLMTHLNPKARLPVPPRSRDMTLQSRTF